METIQTKIEEAETKEASEWSEVWLDNLALNFKPIEDHFDFFKFQEKSEELKAAFDNVDKYVQRYENETEGRKDKNSRAIASVQNISEEVSSLTKQREELIEQARKIVGSIYEGQLIKGVLTSRKGDFYKFRRRYHMSLGHILDLIMEHKEEVCLLLNEEQQELLAYIFNFAHEVGIKPHQYDSNNDYQREFGVRRTFTSSIVLTVPNKRYSSGKENTITTYNIEGFYISPFGLKFIDNGDTIDIYDFVDRYLVKTHKDQILEAKKELSDMVAEEKKKIMSYKEEMANKFAKVLVWRKLREQNE